MWESIKNFFGFGKKSEPVIIEFKTQQAEKDIVVSPAVAEAMKANREVYRHTPSPRVNAPAPKPAVTFSQAPTERKAVSSGSTTSSRRDEVDNTSVDLVTAYAIASMMSTPAYAPIYGSSSSRYDSDCSSSSYSSSSSDSPSSCDSGSSSSGDW